MFAESPTLSAFLRRFFFRPLDEVFLVALPASFLASLPVVLAALPMLLAAFRACRGLSSSALEEDLVLFGGDPSNLRAWPFHGALDLFWPYD